MEFVEFKTTENDLDRRFDTLIRKFLPQMPLSLIYKNIRTGFIRINNKKAKQESKIQLGDVINIEKHLLEKFYLVKNTDKTIKEKNENTVTFIENLTIFKNENILILNKPYNINVQDSKNDKNSLDVLVKSIYTKDSLTFKPGPMHRLDKLTTGLLCFSQNLSCARWFSEKIAEHSIKKTYLALLEGKLEKKQEWIDYLSKDENSTKIYTSKVCDDKIGKRSISIVEPLFYGKYNNYDVTFAKIEIQTGRNHQIRVQCANHGLPLVQDNFYGSKISKMKTDFEQKLYLHCYKLEFPTNEFSIPQIVVADLPNSFKNALKKCLIEMQDKDYNY